MKDMQKAGEFFTKAEELYEKGSYKEAGIHYSKSFNVLKTNEAAAYMAAVSYDNAGKKDKTFSWLRKAINSGKHDIKEKDFKNFSGEPEYSELANIAKLMKKQLDSQAIESKIIIPESVDKKEKQPLLIVFHGFNSNPDEVYPYYKKTAEALGLVVMLPRGDEVIDQNKFAWTNEEEEYNRILEELDEIILKHNIDEDKVILSGFSQGAFLTYALGMVFSEKFKGIIPVAGTVPTNISTDKIENKNLKIVSIVGKRDSENLVKQNKEAAEKFSVSGIKFRLQEFDINHEYPENYNEVILQSAEWIINGGL